MKKQIPINDFYEEIISILTDSHSYMTTLEVAEKHGISREDVLLLREKEEAGELRDIIFYRNPEFLEGIKND